MDLKAAEKYALALRSLETKWKPHPAQIAPGRALFRDGVKRIFLCWGRRTGKSEFLAISAIRWALTNPGQHVAIVGPLQKIARGIFLHSGLLKKLLPDDPSIKIHMTDGRISFSNGATITIYGADDEDSLRGLKFGLLLIDEVKDIDEAFFDVVRPTLIDSHAPMILSGTPPPVASHPFWAMVDTAKTSEEWRYFHATSYQNPFLPAGLIDKERLDHEARGVLDVFTREYLAEFAPGSKRAIFGMFNESDHVRPYVQLWSHIHKKLPHWQLICAMDPGTASCFAVLLAAINNYTGEACFLDEMYVTSQTETSVGRMWPEIEKRMRQIYWPENSRDENQWTIVVDEAAIWARNELLDQFDVSSIPTQKSLNKKADGVGILKDLYLSKKLRVSDRMVKFIWESKGYLLDENGAFIKKNDHLLDAARYALHAANYTFSNTPAPELDDTPEDEKRRVHTIESDWAEQFGAEHEPYLLDLLD